jgi:hypothetical protein
MGARRILLLFAAAALAACGDQRGTESLTGPQLAGRPSSNACDFNGLNSLITSYFPSSRQSPILSLKQSMASAGANTTVARDKGFLIMDSIGYLSRDVSVSVSASAGAQLTIGLINCMFNASKITYPDTALKVFTKALTQAEGGAYYVRGGTGHSENVVLGTEYVPLSEPNNLSGIDTTTASWHASVHDSLTSNENRALIYGYRTASSPLEYEWATVPSGPWVYFNPAVAVSVCDADATPDASAMIHETNIGVLAYFNTDVCSTTPQPLASTVLGGGPRAFAARLARTVGELVMPQPLHATALGNYGSGGTASTFKSKFSRKNVESLVLAFVTGRPLSNIPVNTEVDVWVTVSAPDANNVRLPVLGTCVYLTGTNNNGTPTDITGPHDNRCTDATYSGTAPAAVTEPYSTTASVAKLKATVTKTGGLILVGTANVIERSGTGSAFTKINVKPAK